MMTRRELFALAIATPAAAIASSQRSLERAQIRKVLEGFRQAEIRRALAFYLGDQWPAQVRERRIRQGRPCLVVNLMPDALCSAAHARGKDSDHMPQAERIDLIVEVVRHNRDRQMSVNYYASAVAELREQERRFHQVILSS